MPVDNSSMVREIEVELSKIARDTRRTLDAMSEYFELMASTLKIGAGTDSPGDLIDCIEGMDRMYGNMSVVYEMCSHTMDVLRKKAWTL
jgi:hypothetical protein